MKTIANLQLGDKTYEIKDFRLKDLLEVGQVMDRIAERSTAPRESGFTVATVETAADMLEVLSRGIEGETGESLMAVSSFNDIVSIGEAYIALLRECGILGPAEDAPAPDAIAA